MVSMKEFETLPAALKQWANIAVSGIEARPQRQAAARSLQKEIAGLLKKHKKLDKEARAQTVLDGLGDPHARAEQLRKHALYNPKTHLKYYLFAAVLILVGSLATAYPLLILLTSSDFITLNIEAFSIFENTRQAVGALTSGLVMILLGIGSLRVAGQYGQNKQGPQ